MFFQHFGPSDWQFWSGLLSSLQLVSLNSSFCHFLPHFGHSTLLTLFPAALVCSSSFFRLATAFSLYCLTMTAARGSTGFVSVWQLIKLHHLSLCCTSLLHELKMPSSCKSTLILSFHRFLTPYWGRLTFSKYTNSIFFFSIGSPPCIVHTVDMSKPSQTISSKNFIEIWLTT